MSTAGKQLKGRAARLARLMPAGPSNAARTPFVFLIVVLLGGGLITLLMLNSSLNEGSFELSELKRKTTELTDEQQALQRDVDDRSAPDALERRARELGMVPGGGPAFIDTDGSVKGKPEKAEKPDADPSPGAGQEPPTVPPPADSTGQPTLGPSSSPAAAGRQAQQDTPPHQDRTSGQDQTTNQDQGPGQNQGSTQGQPQTQSRTQSGAQGQSQSELPEPQSGPQPALRSHTPAQPPQTPPGR
ncbi:septum formation initiator family protein [Streptomyces sp. NPDC017979]|uniref:septum formation initiator family protein n=1 Tax=Streptomyces sp. NPDC017979 TaxID=3365024 RepID=UPI00378EC3ED